MSTGTALGVIGGVTALAVSSPTVGTVLAVGAVARGLCRVAAWIKTGTEIEDAPVSQKITEVEAAIEVLKQEYRRMIEKLRTGARDTASSNLLTAEVGAAVAGKEDENLSNPLGSQLTRIFKGGSTLAFQAVEDFQRALDGTDADIGSFAVPRYILSRRTIRL
jgi:hypothetical protein